MTENDSMTVNSQSVDRVQVLEGALTYVQRARLLTFSGTLKAYKRWRTRYSRSAGLDRRMEEFQS